MNKQSKGTLEATAPRLIVWDDHMLILEPETASSLDKDKNSSRGTNPDPLQFSSCRVKL
jgi:hypothetical protein